MKAIKFENRKIKFALFVLGVGTLFVAIICLIFSAGKNDDNKAIKKGGLNMVLPGANVKKDSAKDKLSFYAAAMQDSVKRMEQVRMDPNRQDSISKRGPNAREGIQASHYGTGNNAIELKMKAMRKQLSKQSVVDYSSNEKDILVPRNEGRKTGSESTTDPEMEAINSTLDKLMAIQYPEKNRPSINVAKQPGYSVSMGDENDVTYFGKKQSSVITKGFYGDQNKIYTEAGLTAVVANEQLLQSGASVKLELASSITVNGVTIPAGTAVYGIASIEGERLQIQIPSIRYGNAILPVSLSVFDMDGLEGIYIPGSMPRDVAKESADNAIQSTGIAGAGLSIKTQTVAAGIGAAKSLLSKKVKQVRVTVSAGYKVLLRDNKQMGY